MTRPEPLSSAPARLPRILLADRGDPLAGPLSVAMNRRFDVVERVDAELSRVERLLVAAMTFRRAREQWAERFYKSNLAVTHRSRRARSGIRRSRLEADVVFQTHGLFETSDPRTVIYVDCTHRQSMEQWPAWNPLRGRGLRRWLEREQRQFHEAAHLFAFSEETAHFLVERYHVPPNRVSVVGAGVDVDQVPAVLRTHQGPPTVLFVGNDFERKGGPRLLEAFALLRQRIPDARLRIVGTPAPIAAQEGVVHLGRVEDRARMSRLYAEADVFCLPAHFDPFPGVLLEAMAHGLPCVVTPTCGVPEIVVDGVTGLSIAPSVSFTGDLADALEQLLNDPHRADLMGRHGRQRVEDRFRWDDVLERMAPVIEHLSRPRPDTSAPGTLVAVDLTSTTSTT